MINIKQTKLKCCEDISLIENYEQAVADTTQTWICHHRGEILPCGNYSAKDLQKFGLYKKRPACELIFLTRSEHASMHNKGNHHSAETITKISTNTSKAMQGNDRTKGRIWITNGVVSRMIKPDKPMPEGFVRGRLKQHKKEI